MDRYDIVVIGAGHAGCEAALASARLGLRTLVTTLTRSSVALMPCNPAIGGTAKGHLVRELDALGGEMGRAIDDTLIQSRMLNTGKGPAMHSLRAQADKDAYQKRMMQALAQQPNLTLMETEIVSILAQDGRVHGVLTSDGNEIHCRAVIVAGGVYLDSRIIIGERSEPTGPMGLKRSSGLGDALRQMGFPLRRFKTGTPARIDASTIDYDQMQAQPGDEPIVPFSFMTDQTLTNRALCYLTYTTPETHRIILDNLSRAPMYAGTIRGTGARYCPSIEDKVVRFSDKSRHPIFLEPEGLNSNEWYVQGMSTSMPEDIQRLIYASVPGLGRAKILKYAYAIEYDCIDPTSLDATLESRDVRGLFFAGQVNGTSGYEEAAAQGLVAGVNAALQLKGEEPMLLTRSTSYIGVMLDDLTTKGVDEPYRMMTSRAEYRLSLRQDNADLRLTDIGHRVGLASDARLVRMQEKREQSMALEKLLRAKHLDEPLRRPDVTLADLSIAHPEFLDYSAAAREQAELAIKYEGYLTRQSAEIRRFEHAESQRMPDDIDYESIQALRIEARQKLAAQKPRSLGQASRIPGVSPGDISVLMVYLEKYKRDRIPSSR